MQATYLMLNFLAGIPKNFKNQIYFNHIYYDNVKNISLINIKINEKLYILFCTKSWKFSVYFILAAFLNSH